MTIKRPTLLVDEFRCRRNIRRMAHKAKENGVALRPHFKTHQSAAIGRWFAEEGVTAITVSSVEMADYFVSEGWQDLTIAFPYNPLEAAELEALAKKVKLNVLIESKEALEHLNKQVKAPVGYFLKVDVGTGRTGINPTDTSLIDALAHSENHEHQLKGLLAHAGHAYGPINKKTAQKIFSESIASFELVKKTLKRNDLIISYGDTPTCSVLDQFPGVHELRPGNFVFYDLMQYAFGSCEFEDISICMACPVVAKHAERKELVIYGGAVHFSKDFIEVNKKRNYGLVVKLTSEGWESVGQSYVSRVSQEHGIIAAEAPLLESVKVGDILGVLPVHSCLTADLQRSYQSLNGERILKR